MTKNSPFPFDCILGLCYNSIIMRNRVEYKNILIVEDDEKFRKKTIEYFQEKNTVVGCSRLHQAIEELHQNTFDIILLDVILPDGSGLQLLEHTGNIPVIILSDLGSDDNLLDAFSQGAIDYIVKPASLEIIEARMELRLLPSHKSKLSSHGLVLDIAKRIAKFRDTPLDLTSSEFNILLFLMQNAGNFFTASEIYESVWKMIYLNTTTIKTHLSNLRKKMLAVSKDCSSLIITEFGRGYSFIGGSIE